MPRFLRPICFVLLGFALALGTQRGASAGELAQPTDPVILEVSGAISNTNGPGVARFDLAMLEALEKRSFETATQWTKGVKAFEGVTGKAIVAALGATGRTAKAVALNDYKVEIPLEDFTDNRLIIAYRIDGAAMSVRDKGPLWVMFDFDSDPGVNNETYFSRAIWQLRSIEFH